MQRQAVTDLGAASSGRMETGPIPDSGLSIVCLAPHTSTEDLPGSLLCFGLTLTINTRYSPAWAGSWPEPPPERSATRPLRLSRSERRATRCPCRSCRPGLQATNPARASSAHNSTEFTSFLEVCGGAQEVVQSVVSRDPHPAQQHCCATFPRESHVRGKELQKSLRDSEDTVCLPLFHYQVIIFNFLSSA